MIYRESTSQSSKFCLSWVIAENRTPELINRCGHEGIVEYQEPIEIRYYRLFQRNNCNYLPGSYNADLHHRPKNVDWEARVGNVSCKASISTAAAVGRAELSNCYFINPAARKASSMTLPTVRFVFF